MKSPLNPYQQMLLEKARDLVLGDLPTPWNKRTVVPAAGVIAGGWDEDEHVLLISSDGYSLSDPITGERLLRNRNRQLIYSALSKGGLYFTFPSSSKTVSVFGIYSGDGIHITEDGWEVEVIYPWWPQSIVILCTPFIPGTGQFQRLDRAHRIALERLDDTEIKCGFSPSGKHLMILGSGGAEIISRI